MLVDKRRSTILATALVGGLIVAGYGSADPPAGAIIRAARAPYEAVLNRNAAALCGDFTPTTATNLVAGASQGSTCESAANELFDSTTNEHTRLAALLSKLSVNSIAAHGDHATAVLEDTKVRDNGHNNVRVTLEVEPIALEKSGGRWLISSPAKLRAIDSCRDHIRPSRCTAGARVLVFGILPTSTYSGPSLLPVSTPVKRAGGEELREFEAGRQVVAQTGCLACHRIGDQGNSGPGPDLTHIGSTLSAEQIEHALVYPTAPMPSFKNLPATKLKDVVEFLTLLR